MSKLKPVELIKIPIGEMFLSTSGPRGMLYKVLMHSTNGNTTVESEYGTPDSFRSSSLVYVDAD